MERTKGDQMYKTVVALLMLLTLPARAEVAEITFAKQFGIAYLPLMIMEEDHLIEKHAATLGLPGFGVHWTTITSGAVANDGLLSGRLAFGIGAIPAMLLLHDRTKASGNPVRGVVGVAVMPSVLNVRDPAIKSIADFTANDKIAMPAIKVSNHALVLEMAAEKLYGPGNYAKLDPQTVALAQPDAAAQLMTPHGSITAHFASPPYTVFELRGSGVHPILNSRDVMGDTSLTVLWTTQKFADSNPKVVQAVNNAIVEALDTINADKSAAADRYLRLSGDKISREDLMTVLDDGNNQFSPVPLGVMAFARFMHHTGALRTEPAAWTDVFLPMAHTRPGN